METTDKTVQERLREMGGPLGCGCPACNEAADIIDSLTSRVAELERRVKGVADDARQYADLGDHIICYGCLGTSDELYTLLEEMERTDDSM